MTDDLHEAAARLITAANRDRAPANDPRREIAADAIARANDERRGGGDRDAA